MVSNKSSDNVLIHKKPGKTPSLQHATAVSEETDQNQANKQQEKLLPFSDSGSCTYLMNVPENTVLTFPPISLASLLDAFVDPPEHSAHDKTSLPNGEHPAPAAVPRHSWASAALSSSTTHEKCFQSPPWYSYHSPARMTAK